MMIGSTPGAMSGGATTGSAMTGGKVKVVHAGLRAATWTGFH